MSVTVKRDKKIIPTYVPEKANKMPFFIEGKAYQGACGRVYPIPYRDRLTNVPVDKEYDMITLSNEHIEVNLLPEIGGKVHGAKSKHNGYEFIYQNTVIKPAMVGLAGPWVSGGIEFNWAQHHRPTTFAPLEPTIRKNSDGSVTCWMGEAEPFHRIRGAVGITVYPHKSYVEAKAILYNRTDTPLPFMWWNNLAVRVNSQYKAGFPPDVEYVNDHDRRAVISFPIMKGVYETARPYDYKDGVDGTWFSNIKLPTSVMVMRGQSTMNFLGGYDFSRNAGTVTVADHYVSIGKKMWTWGCGDFGRAWCSNLTDNGDRYIELMTGVYTDNQPDFTYILPGETKEFTQIWYPVQDIGEVANATNDGALSLKQEGDRIYFGAITTDTFMGARVRVLLGDQVLFEKTTDIDPGNAFLSEATLPEGADIHILKLVLEAANGKELVSYMPVIRGTKKKPKTRPIPPCPQEVDTLEELYLHGVHLEQYKHHTYKPEDYYLEALHRDPSDYRCNLGMGRLCSEQGDFDSARKYLNKAIRKIKMRNDNPADTEAIYMLARVEKLSGYIDGAYDLYQAAAWQYPWRSQSYFEIACIDCMRGETEKAIRYLKLSLETNVKHFAARTLLGYLQKDADVLRKVLDDAPQDTFARFALYLLAGEPVSDFILNRPEDVLDAALDFKRAGLYSEALRILETCKHPNMLLSFHKAAITRKPPEEDSMDYCFPNRLEDIAVLSGTGDWRAEYSLGCLYYDRLNYTAAAAAWEKSIGYNGRNPYALRNLSLVYFDHLGRKDEALLLIEKAFSMDSRNSRMLYELLQLQKNLGFSVEKRLALLEAHSEIVGERDDCYLALVILHTQAGNYEKAQQLLQSRRFNIYEGGEGMLTRHHGWLYTLLGAEAMNKGDYRQAEAYLQTALVYPVNYGEGRHYSAQEGNVWYYTGLLKEKENQPAEAQKCFENAANQPSHITEITWFAAKSLEKMGKPDESKALFRRMCTFAQEQLKTADLPGYYGVGTPAPLPFELNVEKTNQIQAYLILTLGEAGLGNTLKKEASLKKLEKLDPTNSKLDFFRKLEIL